MGKARSRADGDYKTDNAVVDFGADGDVTLTHDPDDGLILKSKATADDNPVLLTLQTGETDLAANDVIGKIAFQAPDEGTGTDAILVSAAIQARAEGDHSSSSNATSIDFMVGASEVAATKMTLTSGGKLEVAGGVDIEGGAVFNEDSADVDFRVESNGDANMLFVEGGTNMIGIKTNDPKEVMDVRGALVASGDHATNSNAQGSAHGVMLSSASGTGYVSPISNSTNDVDLTLRALNGGSFENRLVLDSEGDVTVSTGDLIFATSGKGVNLGVTSNTDSNTLDDYEEGDIGTISMNSSGSDTIDSGNSNKYYIKVGKVVHCWFHIVLDGTLGAGSHALEGLPFTSSNSSPAHRGAGCANAQDASSSYAQDGNWLAVITSENVTSATIYNATQYVANDRINVYLSYIAAT